MARMALAGRGCRRVTRYWITKPVSTRSIPDLTGW